uniref:NADH dehydrogenase [ubiquinone] 1 beta subcomplex subunit 1-like n=1 Tax=Myodes glareolus TaxID=447135 RepID=UPI002020CD0F|nr:NADH dehydrogenase [ubiquinone] 1 beta subcomplex subunit 1-like [Myodes glareolus]
MSREDCYRLPTVALGHGSCSAPGCSSHDALVQLVREHWVHVLVPVGFVCGCCLDRRDDVKLPAFRNKRVLLRRELRPNEEVTWK